MKSPLEWKEEDLQWLIHSKVQEDIHLDYKASESLQNTEGKKSEISKDVSSFANSDGGTIIYGIKEDAEKHFPERLDAGSNPKEISKEWLEQVIASRIQRRIDGVRVNPILLTTASPGNFAYVVSIPQSSRAPHQAYDKKFYKRFNFQSVAMEEYEIRDVFRRQESPNLGVVFGLGHPIPEGKEIVLPPLDRTHFQLPLGFSIINESAEPAYYCIVRLWISRKVIIMNPQASSLEIEGSENIEINGETETASKYRFLWKAEQRDPLLYGAPAYTHIGDQIRKENGTHFLRWQINAPRMSERTGAAMLSVVGQRATINPL